MQKVEEGRQNGLKQMHFSEQSLAVNMTSLFANRLGVKS